MAIDSLLPVRRAILTLLKADAALTALVPAAQIYAQAARSNDLWPFIRWGSPSAVPRRASCLDGQIISSALHGFSKGRWSGKRELETAEDHAARIGAAIAAAVDGRRVAIPGGYAAIRVSGSQLLLDRDEASAFHTVQNLRIRAVTA